MKVLQGFVFHFKTSGQLSRVENRCFIRLLFVLQNKINSAIERFEFES